MPNVTPVQSDFSVGEVAPDLQMRSTLDAQRRGVKTLTNFVADSRGPVIRRKGFRFLGKIGDPLPATACTSEWSLTDSIPELVDLRGNGGMSLDRDMGYMAVGGADADDVKIWRNDGGGVWTDTGTIPMPSVTASLYEGFGINCSHSQTAGIMVVGAPYGNDGALDTGAAFVYSGSNSGGWTYGSKLPSNSLSASMLFGWGVEVSEDGSVIAVGAPGTSGVQGQQSIQIFDRSAGTSYTHRQSINVNDSDTGRGKSVALSNDGAILAIGHPEYGITAGQVKIYDDLSGTFTLRQTIDAIILADEGIPGQSYSANIWYFGSGVRFSEDNRSLFINYPGYSVDGTDRNGMLCIYGLNEQTNEYEFCNYFVGTGYANLNAGIDCVVTGEDGNISISYAQGAGSSRGRVDIYA